MHYNYICLTGLIPCTIFGYLWKSKIMLFVSLLGYIFHTNPHNKVIKYIDLSVNVSICVCAMVIERKIIIPAVFSGICYVYNNIIYRPVYIDGIVYNLKHVFLIQFVGVYGYYLLYNHDPCLEFFFICDNQSI